MNISNLSRFSIAALSVAFWTAGLSPSASADSKIVNLYSYRQPFLIKPLLDEFTRQTGIRVNTVFAKKGMLEKIRAAGANNPADAVLTVDIGRLNELKEAGVLHAVESDTLRANIPQHLRHPEGLWFGLTTRARIVLASRDRVSPEEVTSLADLANPKLKGRICTRSGKHPYNIALIASVIAHDGLEKAEMWLRGVKGNLARKPQGNDRAQAKGIYEGVCDVALANNYYMGKMATNNKKPEQKEWANAVRVQFLDQNGRGQHVNISGAAVTSTAKNRDNAVALIEFLSSETAQRIYASDNHEYPVKSGVPLSELVSSWGTFKTDTLSIDEIAKYRKAASMLVDKVGYDDGLSS